ncbi:NAD-binding protein [Nonomuraea sp. CA-143628]|uniref:NAD-binding protein n=1 Tax=Nonomuraea sp. CA-143628 TaxID=3239997 RepID=UPI003D942E5F
MIIGAGWIGLETTAAARAAGAEAAVLESRELPLLRVLGRETAEVFAGLAPRARGRPALRRAGPAGMNVKARRTGTRTTVRRQPWLARARARARARFRCAGSMRSRLETTAPECWWTGSGREG